MANIPVTYIPATTSTGQTTATQATGNGANGPATALAHTANTIPAYQQSLTITPLPNDAPVVLMTREEISRLAEGAPSSDTTTPLSKKATISILTEQQIRDLIEIPPRPKVAFGTLEPSLPGTDRVSFSATLTGVDCNSPLANAICDRLKQDLQIVGVGVSAIEREKCKGGTKISFELRPSKDEPPERIALDAYNGTRRLVLNLQSLGFDPDASAKLINSRAIWRDLSVEEPWDMPKKLSNRRECIKKLMNRRCFGPAVRLLSDLAKVDNSAIKAIAKNVNKGTSRLDSAFSLSSTDDPKDLRAFTAMVCCHLCDTENLYRQIEAGQIILRDVSSRPEPYQRLVFEILAIRVRHLSPQNKHECLEKLLDLPGIDWGELFQNPRARLLLMAFPKLSKVFEKIEAHATDVFFEQLKRLQDKGFTFPGDFPFGDRPIEIVATRDVGEEEVDLLLDLAESATQCTGLINWATGVLQFLSERVLYDNQIERALALRDRIQMAVRFDPDPQVAATFDTVKQLTDKAIAEIDPNLRN